MFDVIQNWIERAGLTREAVLTISNNQTFGYANNPKGEIFRKFLPDRFFEIYVSGDDPVDGMVKMLQVWADVEVHPIVSFHERMK